MEWLPWVLFVLGSLAMLFGTISLMMIVKLAKERSPVWLLCSWIGTMAMVASMGQIKEQQVLHEFAKEIDPAQFKSSGQKTFRGQHQVLFDKGKLKAVTPIPGSITPDVVR